MRLEAEIKAVGSKTASLCPPQSGLEADIKQKGKQIIIVKCMDTKGGKPRWGGDGGVLNGVIGIDMYTLMCIKLMTD